MKWRDTAASRILLLKQRIYRPESLTCYRELLKNQHLPLDPLQELNWEKRKRLLAHAYATVPYYRRKFEEIRLHPDDIATQADWAHVPLLTKEELRNQNKNLISTTVHENDLVRSTTGGSTGIPVQVFQDRRYPLDVIGWRMLGWWGLPPGTDGAFVWRLTRTTPMSKLVNAILWWPSRRLRLDASSMDVDQVNDFINGFNRLKPPLLQGYTGSLHYLAMYAERHGTRMHSPLAIWGTSSPVSASQRGVIERVFQAPFYDQYGCGEVFWLAAQCRERKGLHMFYDERHIEFLDEAGVPCPPGTYGRIALTDLSNYAFPIIRYANGDLGRGWDRSCGCGITLPLMDSVKGRVTDMVKLPDETVLGGDYLTTLFDDIPFPSAVSAFQVIQQADYSLVVHVVPNASPEMLAPILAQVKETLRRKVRDQVPVEMKISDEIANDRGKTRFVISHVP
jgi:phenylacetate-CoA ligase